MHKFVSPTLLNLNITLMRKKILFVVGILFGLMFLNAGLNKFFQYMPVPDNLPENMVKIFNALMEFKWLLPLIAVAEITGGVLFMIPKVRALGAIVIFPVMVGIVLTHLVNDPSGLLVALVLFAVNIWAIIENWGKYLVMIK